MTVLYGMQWTMQDKEAGCTADMQRRSKVKRGLRQACVVVESEGTHEALVGPAGRNGACHPVVVLIEELLTHTDTCELSHGMQNNTYMSTHQLPHSMQTMDCARTLVSCHPACSTMIHGWV